MEITQSTLIEKKVYRKRPEITGAIWRMNAMTEIYNRCANEDVWSFFNLPGELGGKYAALERALREVILEEAKVIEKESDSKL